MKQSRWVIDSCAGAPLFSLTVSWLQGSLLHGCNCTDCDRQCNYTSAHCPTKSSPQCAPHLSPWLHWEAHRAHWLQFSCDLCTLHSDPHVHSAQWPTCAQVSQWPTDAEPTTLLYPHLALSSSQTFVCLCEQLCAPVLIWQFIQFYCAYSFTLHTVLLSVQIYCAYSFAVQRNYQPLCTVSGDRGTITPMLGWLTALCFTLCRVGWTNLYCCCSSAFHFSGSALLLYATLQLCIGVYTGTAHWRIGWLTAQLVSPVHRQCALGSPVQTSWTANSTPQGKHKSFTTSIIIRLATSYWHNIYYIILGALCALTKFFITTPVSM